MCCGAGCGTTGPAVVVEVVAVGQLGQLGLEQAAEFRVLQPFLRSMQKLSQNELSLLSVDLHAVQPWHSLLR